MYKVCYGQWFYDSTDLGRWINGTWKIWCLFSWCSWPISPIFPMLALSTHHSLRLDGYRLMCLPSLHFPVSSTSRFSTLLSSKHHSSTLTSFHILHSSHRNPTHQMFPLTLLSYVSHLHPYRQSMDHPRKALGFMWKHHIIFRQDGSWRFAYTILDESSLVILFT